MQTILSTNACTYTHRNVLLSAGATVTKFTVPSNPSRNTIHISGITFSENEFYKEPDTLRHKSGKWSVDL